MELIEKVISLAKTETDSIGFLPSIRYMESHKKGNLFHQIENGEWVGFLIVGGFPPGGTTRIWQECIEKSARGYGSGRRLFLHLLDKCRKNYVFQIALRCADDLESNLFWESMGFDLVRTIEPNNRRRRKINIYRYQIFDDLFQQSHYAFREWEAKQ